MLCSGPVRPVSPVWNLTPPGSVVRRPRRSFRRPDAPQGVFRSSLQGFRVANSTPAEDSCIAGSFVGGRMRAAGRGNFDCPYEPAAVASIDAAGGIGVGLLQALDQLSEWKALEFCAQLVVRGNINQLITFDYGADVQAGSTNEEGQFPGARNGVNRAVSGPLIVRQEKYSDTSATSIMWCLTVPAWAGVIFPAPNPSRDKLGVSPRRRLRLRGASPGECRGHSFRRHLSQVLRQACAWSVE